ncbi:MULTISPECIES: hypothetical protein [Trichocoleus]|uniref:Uncharacterized protein n=1 Tax=Trichocoleus desertorum GB2-A4 TaxID=2933944 RepID=A0ABV0JBT4_9CYAN|nr:hypothetical protein [Trichocoleus sp. FACHB-46]MBD1865380.1 hypothetical protein [Trichocoleus sp. FACHB-46]
MENFLPIIKYQIVQEIIFISLSKLDKKFPVNLNKLLSLGDYSKILTGKVDEDKNLYLAAVNLGYSGSSISDEIINLVETSICDYMNFAKAGKQLNDREENEKIRERLSKAYAPYSESFGSLEEELCKNFREFLDKYCLSIGLRELGEVEEIAKAIHLDLSNYKRNWLKHQVDNSNTFEALNSLKPLFQEFPDLMPILEEKVESLKEKMNVSQVLINALRSRSWSPEEFDYLDGHTVEDYKQWLLERNSDQYYMVKQGLSMGVSSLRQAIIELAQESRLNAMRAKNLYNIDIV